jgi:hypothetical protein
MFMLVGETDRSRVLLLPFARDGAPAFLSETGAGWHYRKDGLTVRQLRGVAIGLSVHAGLDPIALV